MESVLKLCKFDQMVSSGELRLIHSGRSSNLYLGSFLRQANCIYKEFIPRYRLDVVKAIFLGSRAKRAISASRSLKKHGFSVLDVIGIIESDSLIATSRSVVVTKFEKDAVPLKIAFFEISSRKERLEVLYLLASEVARMHQLGIAHDDMNLGNILLFNDSTGCRFIWSDIDRVRVSFFYCFRLNSRQVLKNLRQLGKIEVGLTTREMVYFFISYRKLRNIKGREAKKVFLSLAAKLT